MLVIIFMVMMPILLMNLLVGLAVGDIEAVRKNAALKRLAMQVSPQTRLAGAGAAVCWRSLTPPHTWTGEQDVPWLFTPIPAGIPENPGKMVVCCFLHPYKLKGKVRNKADDSLDQMAIPRI